MYQIDYADGTQERVAPVGADYMVAESELVKRNKSAQTAPIEFSYRVGFSAVRRARMRESAPAPAWQEWIEQVVRVAPAEEDEESDPTQKEAGAGSSP